MNPTTLKALANELEKIAAMTAVPGHWEGTIDAADMEAGRPPGVANIVDQILTDSEKERERYKARDEGRLKTASSLTPLLSMGGLAGLTAIEGSGALNKKKSTKERVKDGASAAFTGSILASEAIHNKDMLKGLAQKGIARFTKKAAPRMGGQQAMHQMITQHGARPQDAARLGLAGGQAAPAVGPKPISMPNASQQAARANMLNDFMPAGKFSPGAPMPAAKPAPAPMRAAAPVVSAAPRPVMNAARPMAAARPSVGQAIGKGMGQAAGQAAAGGAKGVLSGLAGKAMGLVKKVGV